MTVRRADLGDAVAIASLERSSAHDPWSERSVRESLAQPTCHAFVAGAQAIVGHAIISCAGEEGELLTLAVHPSSRRQGHANRLLDACNACWQAHAVIDAFLEVRVSNDAALSLYSRRGWKHVGTRESYYANREAALILQKRIR